MSCFSKSGRCSGGGLGELATTGLGEATTGRGDGTSRGEGAGRGDGAGFGGGGGAAVQQHDPG